MPTLNRMNYYINISSKLIPQCTCSTAWFVLLFPKLRPSTYRFNNHMLLGYCLIFLEFISWYSQGAAKTICPELCSFRRRPTSSMTKKKNGGHFEYCHYATEYRKIIVPEFFLVNPLKRRACVCVRTSRVPAPQEKCA